ncbi:MAG: hypothetical protein A2Y72_05995 [Chloroflexi bacterium RBG_13_53_26]|jgi:uncharacterized membrane protein YjgN (DUF898 family)|nr:MAG: hypothetical protein A2Y72_05995 [Chloroflexi bacterium RBG_13_53_26]
MAKQGKTVGIVYTARGRDIFIWCAKTAVFSLITLGLYLPVAANSLVKYLCEHTEVHIGESQISET